MVCVRREEGGGGQTEYRHFVVPGKLQWHQVRVGTVSIQEQQQGTVCVKNTSPENRKTGHGLSTPYHYNHNGFH